MWKILFSTFLIIWGQLVFYIFSERFHLVLTLGDFKVVLGFLGFLGLNPAPPPTFAYCPLGHQIGAIFFSAWPGLLPYLVGLCNMWSLSESSAQTSWGPCPWRAPQTSLLEIQVTLGWLVVALSVHQHVGTLWTVVCAITLRLLLSCKVVQVD